MALDENHVTNEATLMGVQSQPLPRILTVFEEHGLVWEALTELRAEMPPPEPGFPQEITIGQIVQKIGFGEEKFGLNAKIVGKRLKSMDIRTMRRKGTRMVVMDPKAELPEKKILMWGGANGVLWSGMVEHERVMRIQGRINRMRAEIANTPRALEAKRRFQEEHGIKGD